MALALAASSVAFGAMSTNERVAQLEKQMQCVYMDVIYDDCGQQTMTCGAQTAPARPMTMGDKCRCGYGWFVEFDVIYWHPKVGGTEFAYTDDSPVLQVAANNTANPGFPVKGRVKDIDFGWDWGFKVALGYNFDHDNWDGLIKYTRLDSEGSESTRPGQNSLVVPLRGSSSITNGPNVVNVDPQPTGTFIYCASAKSEFDIDYDRLDLEMGRNFFVSPKLSMRPYVGLVAAWIDLYQNIRYSGGAPSSSNLGLDVNTVHIHDESDFKGVGPKLGFDSKWYLGHKFSVFGNISTALVYGHFDVSHQEYYSLLEDTNEISLNGDTNRFAPNSVYELGLSYDTYLNDNKQHLSLALGFEGQYWFRVNQMLKIDDFAVLKFERFSEDVSFHGVTFKIRLDF